MQITHAIQPNTLVVRVRITITLFVVVTMFPTMVYLLMSRAYCLLGFSMDQLETAPRLRLKASGDEGVEHRKECAKADQEQVRIFALPPFRSNRLPLCRHSKHMRSQFLTEGVLRTFIRLNQLSLHRDCPLMLWLRGTLTFH